LNNRSIVYFVLASGSVLVLFLSTNLIDVSGASTAEVKIPQGVDEGGNHYEPETLKIGKGTTVKWTNEDDSIHTVTSGTPETSSWGTKFDSSYLSSGKTYEHNFKSTGTFNYICTLHPYMTAKIVVSKESTPPVETAEKEPSVTVDTTPNTNINVSKWSNFTDSEYRFSIEY
jgi:plastocyanin